MLILYMLACSMVDGSSLMPFLIQCADRRCDIPSPVFFSSVLVQNLAQNQLVVRDDTSRDGNCGVHGFYLSLADLADRTHDHA